MFGSLRAIDLGVGLVCIAIIAGFTGVMFPREIADQGEGRLPKKFLALVLFAGINIVVFLVFVAFLHLWRNQDELAAVVKAAGLSGVADLLGEPGKGKGISPLSAEMIAQAAVVFFALFGFRRWRQIEAGALRQLHNISLIAEDARNLSAKLRQGSQLRSSGADETQGALDRLQRRVSVTDASNPERSLAVKWTKLNALLEVWTDKPDWSDTLRQVELPNLDSIRLADRRRNTLARRLDEHVVKVERGEADPRILAEIGQLVRRDDVSPEDILKELRNLRLAPEASGGERSLGVLLTPLIEYFHEEYDEALAQMADATAKSVVMSGDEAVERMKTLKLYGFTGLGDVKVINLHGAIFITFSVFVVLMLLFTFYVQIVRPGIPTNYSLLTGFAASTTLAVVAGAMVGGLRTLARAESTPWGWYILTALVMASLHLVIILTVVGIDTSAAEKAQRAMEEYQARQYTFASLLIGSIIPFCLVLAICLMSRREMLQGISLPVWVRDGIVLAAVMAAVAIVIVFIAEASGVKSDTALGPRLVRVTILLALIGAFIGALVVKRVREAALSRVAEEELVAEINQSPTRSSNTDLLHSASMGGLKT